MRQGQDFMGLVEQTDTGCWIWQAGTSGGEGYGKTRWGGKRVYAHRLAYELFVGPIPEGLVIDHLCRVRLCVNPDHLEAVTLKVNILRGESPSAICARKTECPNGHPLSGDNLRADRTGRRRCRTCFNDRKRRAYQRKKGVAA